MPTYQYAISGITDVLLRENPFFYEALPSSRHRAGGDKNPGCGVFLEGVAEFLKNHLQILEEHYGEKIETIRIILEKHGAFYHPCRVILNNLAHRPLAVNGAVTDEARTVMKKEVAALQNLWSQGMGKALPEVFFTEDLILDEEGRASFFAAPWFEGFCEFHWSLQKKTLEILLWEDGGEQKLMKKEALQSLFQQAAAILTRAYDFDCFRQIFPWHHAAGDFVARVQGLDVDVRLITVRQYENLFSLDPGGAEFSDKVEALMYFLWNMLLRMRLDRLDGIGELVWAPDFVVPSAISGFFEGLSEKAARREDIAIVMEALPDIVLAGGEEGLFETHEEIVSAYNPKAPEIGLIRDHLRSHTNLVHEIFRQQKREKRSSDA
jgi:hypothetical protein